MKRKYPKQNRPGRHPEDETDTHGEPKIPSHRKDVAAYFLGGGAAITLTIASGLFSSNPSVAIFWFWVTGFLGVTSGCLFWAAREKHAAIIRFWFFGVFVVSLGCSVWAWVNRARNATEPPFEYLTIEKGTPIVVPRTTASPSITTPTPTFTAAPIASPTRPPAPPSQFSLTPKQIADKLREKSSTKKEELVKALENLPVDWTLFFNGTSRQDPIGNRKGYLLVFFRSGQSVLESPMVSVSVPLEGNERLPLTDKGQRFRVRGVIEQVIHESLVTLKDGAVLERLP